MAQSGRRLVHNKLVSVRFGRAELRACVRCCRAERRMALAREECDRVRVSGARARARVGEDSPKTAGGGCGGLL